MNKLFLLLLSALLTLNFNAIAKDRINPVAHTNEYYEMNANSQDFNFAESSNYLTDEQLEDAQKINEVDEKHSWLEKIINSSHFSSKTATKTYIPINKVQK